MITVEGVTKRFGQLTAVDDVSFRIDPGEVVGFLGPNGAGKTTTMRLLTGTLQPDEGRVLFDGRSIGDDALAARRRVGYLPEANPLYDEMLVCDYLEYVGRLRSLARPELRRAVRTAAERTGLEDVFFRPVSECSKGYRQRIGLAGSILHEPEILILDEPTEGLDPNQRVEIRRLVNELGRDRTVLLSTHVMQEVEAVCGRLLIINRGRLVADGDVVDLIAGAALGAHYVVEAEGDGVADAVSALPDIEGVVAEVIDGRNVIRFVGRGADDPRPRIARLAAERGWTLWELHRERASLEQVFRELTLEAPAPGQAPAGEAG